MQEIHMNIIGFIAGTCTTMSFVPQVMKIIRTRHVRDISLHMYLMLTFGIVMWLIYGVVKDQIPIIVANSVSLVLCSMILTAKLVFRGRA
ncbi:MAG: SemiSWEET transporter [Candidatus Omnitrophica bacterium]|nr:SemiSWEET transporter [Candidatus Omnitrophota bacterium]MDD5487437.1 SemiSWEET transporter [Candidatus Omnitrophota bacterium]